MFSACPQPAGHRLHDMGAAYLTHPSTSPARHDSCLAGRDHLSVLPLMLLILLPFLFLSESLLLSPTHLWTHYSTHRHTHTHIFSLPVAFLIMHFLKWAKCRAGAKHQAMKMWKLTSFRGVRRLVGESKAKQHDLITDPMHVDAVQYVPCLILSWASIFLYSCGVLEIALSHFRLLCSLPGCPVDSCPVT